MSHSPKPFPLLQDSDDASQLEVAKADPAAFAYLYDRYIDLIYRYCDRRLRDREASEDATSIIFEKAFSNLAKCPLDGFRPWLFTIAHNVVVDMHRRRRAQASLEDATSVPDVATGPEEVVVSRESAMTVWALLDALSPDQRAVIELRLAGLSGTESMAVLGISRDVLGARTFRAMNKMRSLLEAAGAKGGLV